MSGLDREWLGRWVQPHHLDDRQIEAHRREFASHPARLLIASSFLRPGIADAVRGFLECEARYRQVYGLVSRGSREASERDWLAADPSDRFARFHVLESAKPEFRMSEHLMAYLKLRRAWVDARMASLFKAMCGVPLGRITSYVHAMTVGDYLSPHGDVVENRRLAYVLFLTGNWNPARGGVLTILDHDDRAWRIEPEYNTLVVFDVTAHAQHAVSEISAGEGQPMRITWGGWIAGADTASS
jgi:Rps23 Pro-64 3,4-dihydroxylase Tpa1-like proline 4-hydroxylase